MMHAEALLDTGQETEAAESLKRLTGRADFTPNQNFLLGWLLGRAHLYAEAIEVLKATPKNSPDLFSHQYGLALACFLGGKIQDTIAILNDLAHEGEKRPELFALLGTAQEKNGNLLEAYNAFRQGILNNPTNSLNYLDIASLASQHRNYDLAAELLTQGVERIHNDYRLYLSRGLVFSLERKLAEAHGDYLKASAMAPQEPQVALALGLNYMEMDQGDDAVAIFQRAADLHMQDSRPYYFLEQALLRKGARPGSPDFARAAEAIASALAIDPIFVWGLVERSRLSSMQGKDQEALADLQRAQQLQPQSGIIRYRLAQTYQKLGDEAKAKELFAQAEKSIHEEAERVQQKNMLTIMAATTSHTGQSFDDRLGGSQ
jgi:tetratricopeptide (TPR) repeat protein